MPLLLPIGINNLKKSVFLFTAFPDAINSLAIFIIYFATCIIYKSLFIF